MSIGSLPIFAMETSTVVYPSLDNSLEIPFVSTVISCTERTDGHDVSTKLFATHTSWVYATALKALNFLWYIFWRCPCVRLVSSLCRQFRSVAIKASSLAEATIVLSTFACPCVPEDLSATSCMNWCSTRIAMSRKKSCRCPSFAPVLQMLAEDCIFCLHRLSHLIFSNGQYQCLLPYGFLKAWTAAPTFYFSCLDFGLLKVTHNEKRTMIPKHVE